MKRKLAGSRAEARWQKRGFKGAAAFTLIELLVLPSTIRPVQTSPIDIDVGLGDGVYQRRHGTRFNVFFCDGHVETLRISDLFTTQSDAVPARWNNDGLPHRELVKW